MCQEWLHVSSRENQSLFLNPPFPPPSSRSPGTAELLGRRQRQRDHGCLQKSVPHAEICPPCRNLSPLQKSAPLLPVQQAGMLLLAFPLRARTLDGHTNHTCDAQMPSPSNRSPTARSSTGAALPHSPRMVWPCNKSVLSWSTEGICLLPKWNSDLCINPSSDAASMVEFRAGVQRVRWRKAVTSGS